MYLDYGGLYPIYSRDNMQRSCIKIGLHLMGVQLRISTYATNAKEDCIGSVFPKKTKAICHFGIRKIPDHWYISFGVPWLKDGVSKYRLPRRSFNCFYQHHLKSRFKGKATVSRFSCCNSNVEVKY